MGEIASLLVGLGAIVVLAKAFGAVARLLRQPAVVGEIMAGILVGPTLFHGGMSAGLFSAGTLVPLTALANLALVLFMFLVGIEVVRPPASDSYAPPSSPSVGLSVPLPPIWRPSRLARQAVCVAAGALLLPFAGGVLLAPYLARHQTTSDGTAFTLFLGAAFAVTAFPVLARILVERDLHRTEVGRLALASAAINDAFAWILVTASLMAAGNQFEAWRLLLAASYVVALIMVRYVGFRGLPSCRLHLSRRGLGSHQRDGGLAYLRAHTRKRMAVRDLISTALVLVGLLLSCGAAERLNLHFAIGAFLFGAVMASFRPSVEPRLPERLARIATVILLPAYFVVAGMAVDLSSVLGSAPIELVAILVVAIGAKVLGTLVAARLCHMPARLAATLATLMNTRGLTELVVLGIGRQAGIIDDELYSLMVVMALATTVLTWPALDVIASVDFTRQRRLSMTRRITDPS
jgi:Kef-type K+ transport system membrane component KefB